MAPQTLFTNVFLANMTDRISCEERKHQSDLKRIEQIENRPEGLWPRKKKVSEISAKTRPIPTLGFKGFLLLR